jgi:leucine dehydrogenase
VKNARRNPGVLLLRAGFRRIRREFPGSGDNQDVDQGGAGTPLIGLDHEELVIRRGRRSGVYTVVAVHSTRLGPALGGCRLWRYASSADAARDALRLSRAMTFKAAAAGVLLGGGKGVICLRPGQAPTGAARRDVLLDFADTVNVLEGAYLTAEDVGTSAQDMAVIAERSEYATGLPRSRGGSGDPSSITALGVEAAIRACCDWTFGSRDLRGRTVAVVGVGRVGTRLARRLARAGAGLVLADIDERKRELVEKLPGARWEDPNVALQSAVDVLAPCALGGAINETNVSLLRCRVICGSANNQLAHDGLAEDLAAADIVYAPDFIANAGGLINIAVELQGYDPERARRGAAGIEGTMATLLADAARERKTPLACAYELSRRRLSAWARE